VRKPIKHRDAELIKRIGSHIREVRLQRNLSQSELANLCDVELSTINRIELGKMSPTITHLFIIAEVLKVKPADFFDKDIK
jgi:transcriptional regulator with XRE-family HTH domain